MLQVTRAIASRCSVLETQEDTPCPADDVQQHTNKQTKVEGGCTKNSRDKTAGTTAADTIAAGGAAAAAARGDVAMSSTSLYASTRAGEKNSRHSSSRRGGRKRGWRLADGSGSRG